MFANFPGLDPRDPAPDYERGFVESVRVRERAPRDRRTERLLVLCWIAILLKCAFVAWLIPHYRMPFSPLWVIAPTLVSAAVVTGLYVWRD